ncbi:MAG: 16S rRNA processing protein RimM [candidate division Zixibacteria bacterium RBG_16_40_9]|nr:MAG: 16S rRNA processing protein RimM [candidate division Zixibacteria bacterium RBG_16_40_9]
MRQSKLVPGSQSQRVSLGKITKIRGLKGELVVSPLTSNSNTLFNIKEVFLSEEKPPFIIEKVRRLNNKVLLKLKEIDRPEQAQSLVGKYIEVEKVILAKLEPDQYYTFDLIGLEVETEAKEYLGKVKEIIENPANAVIWVESKMKNYYIPATKEAVLKVDLINKKILVNFKLVVEE